MIKVSKSFVCRGCTDQRADVIAIVAVTTYTYVSLQPYTLQMHIAPNAKCQRVLVLALRLVDDCDR